MPQDLIAREGARESQLEFLWSPQIIAFSYNQLSWLLYAHGMGRRQPRMGDRAVPNDFADEYGVFDSMADLFRQIGHDERVHNEESIAAMDAPRFD